MMDMHVSLESKNLNAALNTKHIPTLLILPVSQQTHVFLCLCESLCEAECTNAAVSFSMTNCNLSSYNQVAKQSHETVFLQYVPWGQVTPKQLVNL